MFVEELYVYDTTNNPDNEYLYSDFVTGHNVNTPITAKDYEIAIEHYATTDQTKKIGLKLNQLF